MPIQLPIGCVSMGVCVCVCVNVAECERACGIQIYSKQFYSNRKKLIRSTYEQQQQTFLIKGFPHTCFGSKFIYLCLHVCCCACVCVRMC